MTITPDAVIQDADLDDLLASLLTTLKADNAQLPGAMYVPFRWLNPQSGVPGGTIRTLPIPFDCFVESVAVRTNDVVGAMSVAITNSGTGRNFPITVAGTGASGVVNFSRLLYDGTKGPLVSFATVSQAVRVWNKGSLTTIDFTTTNTANPSVMDVVLVLRSIFGRD